jgi:hypothetical protein
MGSGKGKARRSQVSTRQELEEGRPELLKKVEARKARNVQVTAKSGVVWDYFVWDQFIKDQKLTRTRVGDYYKIKSSGSHLTDEQRTELLDGILADLVSTGALKLPSGVALNDLSFKFISHSLYEELAVEYNSEEFGFLLNPQRYLNPEKFVGSREITCLAEEIGRGTEQLLSGRELPTLEETIDFLGGEAVMLPYVP